MTARKSLSAMAKRSSSSKRFLRLSSSPAILLRRSRYSTTATLKFSLGLRGDSVGLWMRANRAESRMRWSRLRRAAHFAIFPAYSGELVAETSLPWTRRYNRQHQQSQRGGRQNAANYYRREWPLHLRACSGGEGHGNEAKGCHQCRHEYWA